MLTGGAALLASDKIDLSRSMDTNLTAALCLQGVTIHYACWTRAGADSHGRGEAESGDDPVIFLPGAISAICAVLTLARR